MAGSFIPQMKANILIIDDTPGNLHLLNVMLSQYYEIQLAPNGNLGLLAAHSSPPDLILLDVMMPEINGYEVAAQLKADEQTAGIPIIFISALNDTESKVRAFAAGGVDYITKPFHEDEVLARVNTHLLLRALYRQVQTELVERVQTENTLRESEAKFRTISETAPFAIVVSDPQQKIIYLNRKFTELFGCTIEEIPTVAEWWTLICPDEALRAYNRNRWNTAMVEAIKNRSEIVPQEFLVTCRNGMQRYIEWRLASTGALNVVIGTDFTERKLAEANLVHQNERMGILHTMEQAIAASLDLDKILELLTQKVVEQLQVDACAVLLLNPTTNRLKFAAKQGFHTRALDATNLSIGDGLAGIAAQDRQTVYIADLTTLKDTPGLMQAISDESLVTYFGIPLIAKEQLLGVLEIFHRTELALDPSWLEFLETLADQVAISIDNARLMEITQQNLRETNALYRINQDLIATIDTELLMKDVVDLLQKSFGYYYVQIFVADQITGDFIMRAGSGKIGQQLKNQNFRLSAGEGIVGFTAETGKPFFTNDVDQIISFVRPPYLPDTKSELAVPIKVGAQFLGLLDVHHAPPDKLTERDAQLVTAVADQLAVALQKARLYTDLQEALRQEQTTRSQLIQAEKLTIAGRLLASVSHELNNPIQAIQNALFLLKEEKGMSAQGKQDLTIVLSETDRMATLLERLRTTYQPVSQEEFQPVQINDLIEDTCALVANHLRHNHIAYVFHAGPEMPAISCLPDQLKQVILNLFVNAADAMAGGGNLTISTQFLPDSREVLIEVSDTGIGIENSILPDIFDAFVTNKKRGTGLGLTISYEIILKHRGRIEAKNNPDRGATIRVWLPVDSKGKA